MTPQLNQVQNGWTAFDQKGSKIGEIEEVGRDYMLVTKGLIFVHDVFIPNQAIRDVDPGSRAVEVAVDKDRIDDMGWDSPPEVSKQSTAASAATGKAATEAVNDGARVTNTAAGAAATGTGRTKGKMATEDTLSVPAHKEELVADRRQAQTGEVTVDKHVVEERAGLDVPVTHDEVEIRRRTVDRPATGEGAYDDGDTIHVPVMAEQVEVSRQDRIVEEVEISKRPVTETQRVEGTVRREEIDVEAAGDTIRDDLDVSGTGESGADLPRR